MLTSRLVSMIEQHAEQLTERIVHQLRTDPRTPSYHHLDAQEDHDRVFAVVHNLGKYLDRESDTAMEWSYRKLGQKRFREGVPLAEVVCALFLTKQVIRHYVQTEGWVDTALDLRQQLELYALIERFFERAIYFTVLSFEEEARAAGKMAPPPKPRKRKLTGAWALANSTSGF